MYPRTLDPLPTQRPGTWQARLAIRCLLKMAMATESSDLGHALGRRLADVVLRSALVNAKIAVRGLLKATGVPSGSAPAPLNLNARTCMWNVDCPSTPRRFKRKVDSRRYERHSSIVCRRSSSVVALDMFMATWLGRPMRSALRRLRVIGWRSSI